MGRSHLIRTILVTGMLSWNAPMATGQEAEDTQPETGVPLLEDAPASESDDLKSDTHAALAGVKTLLQDDRTSDAFSQLATMLASHDEASPLYQGAQFMLAKVLFALDLPLSSSYVLGDIVEAGEEHAHFYETVDWFLRIQRQVPGDEESLSRLADCDPMLYPPDEADDIRFMVGRYFYGQESLDEAKESLDSIEPSAGLPYLKARFLLGVIHTRENAAQPALEAFKSILRFQRDVSDSPEIQRMADKAILALGRIFYTAGQFDTAVRYYDRVDDDHPGWLDSLFEISWTYYQLGNHSRALGNLHTLNSPYFADSYHPEALILQAVILHTNCHFGDALRTVRRFVDDYKPLKDELETQLRQTRDPNAFYTYLAGLSQGGERGLSLRLKRVINAALKDARLRRLLRHVVHLDQETLALERLLKVAPAGPARDLVASTLTILVSYRDMVVADAGQAARDRLERVHTELRGLLSQALRIKVEVLRGQRREFSLAKRMSADEVASLRADNLADPETDAEHMYWPFNGEYWRDELGAYTFEISNRCLDRERTKP